MPAYYFDTSALVKRYVDEDGSAWVAGLLAPDPGKRVLVASAVSLAEEHALRGYDAVHLAAAMLVAKECEALGFPLTLVSADLELNEAATAEGLAVEDPNRHP